MIGFPLVVLVVAVAVFLIVRQPDRGKRALMLKRTGFVVMAVPSGLFGLFVVGETFADPGGWEALALIAAWALPLALLAGLAWLRPNWAVWVFAVIVGGLIGVAIWFAIDPEGWRAFEDHRGPIRDIATFVVAFAIAFLGLKKPRSAGILLLVLGLVPLAIILASVQDFAGVALLAVVTSGPILTGILYLLSVAVAAGSIGGTGISRPTNPGDHPPKLGQEA
jgi:hypothetical protein